MHRYLLSILIAFLLFNHAEAPNIDSLMTIVDNSSGRIKVESLIVLAKTLSETSPELSIAYSKEAISESERTKDQELQIKASVLTAKLFVDQKKTDSALIHYRSAVSQAMQLSDFYVLADINHEIGNIYYAKSENIKTEKYYKEALKYSSKNNDSIIHIDILINLGYLYNSWGKHG